MSDEAAPDASLGDRALGDRVLRRQDRRFYLASFHRPPLMDTVRDALQQGANVNVDLLDVGAIAMDAASLMGNLELMRMLLQHGGAVNHMGRDGFSALHRAVLTGNIPMARLLLATRRVTDEPIQVDLLTRDNPLTSLQIVFTRGGVAAVQMAQLLIDHGANVHIRDEESGESLAHLARTPELLACLEQHGVNVCEPAKADGFTPLHYACLKGNLAVVQYLVLQGRTQVDLHSKQGYAGLHYACHKGHFEIVRWLVESAGADPRQVTDCGNSAFHVTCTVKQTQLAVWFMNNHGFTATEMASTGLSPLHYACLSTRTSDSSDGTSLVQALMQRQPAGTRFDTPIMLLLLHLAADWSPGICKTLVEDYNFDLMAVHKERIPLNRAARQGTPETLDCLATLMKARSLNLDTQDVYGWTALHYAVAKRDTKKVRILLQAGCSVHVVDLDGRTPLHVAARRLARSSRETSPVNDGENEGEQDDKGASTTENDEPGKEEADIMQMLLSKGADPSRVDSDGRLPLGEDCTSLSEVFCMTSSAATLVLFEHEKRISKRPARLQKGRTRKRMRL